MRKIVSLLSAIVLATLTTLGLGNTPALAAWSDCPVAEICWWQHANALGAWGHRPASAIYPGTWSMGSWGNQASSWRSRLGPVWTVKFSDAGDGTGNYLIITPNCCSDQQANFVGAYNDWLGGITVY